MTMPKALQHARIALLGLAMAALKINRFLFTIVGLLGLVNSLQALATIPLQPIQIQRTDQEALQRGAALFMNYCSGCHSLRYLRYNRLATDLGLLTFDGAIDKDLLKNNLIFTQATIDDPIQISLPETDARQWFGRMPPDLSLTAREKSPAWIYTYLTSFYADDSRPFGTNNLLVPNVSMPNVLSPLSGTFVAIKLPSAPYLRLERQAEGDMTEPQFHQAMHDIVTFLTYAAEPNQPLRQHLGYQVLAYLCLLLIIVYLLWRRYVQNYTDY